MRSFMCFMLIALTAIDAAEYSPEDTQFIYFHISGPAIVWKTLRRNASEKRTVDLIACSDIEDHLVMLGCERNVFHYNETFVKDEGYFIGLHMVKCNFDAVAREMDGVLLTNLSQVLETALTTNFTNMSQFVSTTDVYINQTFLTTGQVPVPPPPAVILSTTNKQTILLSCDESTCMSILNNFGSICEAIEHDVAATLSHPGVIARCTVSSMLRRAADATRMLPGDGTAGLTVDVTITQDIIEGHPNNPYNTHTMSSALMSMSLTETNEVYAKSVNYTSNDTIRAVAVYENMVYSPLDCEYLCIIALMFFVSVVYIMLIIFIITLVATKYYLVKDFQWLEDNLKYWTGRNIIL